MRISPDAIRTIPCPRCFGRSTYDWCEECLGTGRVLTIDAIRSQMRPRWSDIERRGLVGALVIALAALLAAIIVMAGCAGRISPRGWPAGPGIHAPSPLPSHLPSKGGRR